MRRPLSDAELAIPWQREGEVAGWLSRSAWSLVLIALWRMRFTNKKEIVVWIPDFFCNDALLGLRFYGVRLVFYPVTEAMSPDMDQCRAIGKHTPPDLFLFVHYFGRPINHSATRDFCKFHAAWLIEDAAHSLLPKGCIGSGGDFVIFSPHKHLPVPDGALLIVRSAGPSRFESEHFSLFGDTISWLGQLTACERGFHRGGGCRRFHVLVWLLKRTLQKFGVGSQRQFDEKFAEQIDPNQRRSVKMISPRQSLLSKRLLGVLVLEMADVQRRRQRTQLLVDQLLHTDSTVPGVFPAERPAKREWTSYLASYQGRSDTVEAVYRSWQSNFLPVTTWPDLPLEVVQDRYNHDAAWFLRHSRIYLPVHQSISHRLLLRQCSSQRGVSAPESSLLLIWDGVTREQWKTWMRQAGRSNLLQSWAYGEAKSQLGGWIVKRGVFHRDGDPVAFVQVLQKRIFGTFLVSRINRGPLVLASLSDQERHEIWRKLMQLGRLGSGCLLSVAPEMSLSGQSLAMMASMNFRQFSTRAFESAWIDLGKNPSALRQGLDGKWRNMLNSSERTELRLEIATDQRWIEWMFSRYASMMMDKHFSGPPIDLLQAFRRSSDLDDHLQVFCAIHNGDPVAGICVARHGNAATYLLGWNGELGRSLKANQFLLWKAIIHLQQEGLRWFDLGGISEEQTPGITAFKLGLNGERYELVGEYWRW